MKMKQRKALTRALKIAAIIELPLFVPLAASLLVFNMGPHDTLPMILFMTQIVGLAAMSPLDRLDSNNAFVIAAIWLGVLTIQMGVLTLLFYWMLRASSGEDEGS